MVINRWWEHRPDESFWLEITQREDLGSDLHAPQTNESGGDYWSYSLVREVQDGDIVFHYSKRDHAIALWSRAGGGWWEDEIFWGARGTVGRSNDPYDRPGWVHGLDGPFPTTAPLTLSELRRNENRLLDIRDALKADHEPPLYFPFELGTRRELRPAQGYLFKLPAAVVEAFPSLERPSAERRRVRRGERRKATVTRPDGAFGTTYRRPDEESRIPTATRSRSTQASLTAECVDTESHRTRSLTISKTSVSSPVHPKPPSRNLTSPG